MQQQQQQQQGYSTTGQHSQYGRPGGGPYGQQPPQPPGYGNAPYQSYPQVQMNYPPSAPPSTQSHQWQQPATSQPQQQSWGQQSPLPPASTYTPSNYGAMPPRPAQGAPPALPPRQQASQQPYSTASYPQASQNYPQPSYTQNAPQPPPKPPTYPPQQSQPAQQAWNQQYSQPPAQGYQQPPGAGPWAQHGNYNSQTPPQQPYNATAPPPPSTTPGGSYFPPTVVPPLPTSSTAAFTTISSPTVQSPTSSTLSPNEQNPAYIPPSLSGQGIAQYIPTNNNPQPGVYVPPPPDIPAWTQSSASGAKKFKYTKPTASAGSQYPQGSQSAYPQPTPVQTPMFPAYGQAQTQAPPPQQSQYSQGTYQYPQKQAQYALSSAQQQSAPQYGQQAYQATQQGTQGQWNAAQSYPSPPLQQQLGQAQQHVQQPSWQPQSPNSRIKAPVPLNGQLQAQQQQQYGSHNTSPQNSHAIPASHSQPVSPISHRASMTFSRPSHDRPGSDAASPRLGRKPIGSATGSIKSINSVREHDKHKRPSSSASVTGASALGFGGPSDWEHFDSGIGDIDDTAEHEAITPGIKLSPLHRGDTAIAEMPAETSPKPRMGPDLYEHREREYSDVSLPDTVTSHDERGGHNHEEADYMPTPPLAQAPAPLSFGRPGSAQQAEQVPKPLTMHQVNEGFALIDGGFAAVEAELGPRDQPASVASDRGTGTPGHGKPPIGPAKPQQQIERRGTPQQTFAVDSGGWAAPSDGHRMPNAPQRQSTMQDTPTTQFVNDYYMDKSSHKTAPSVAPVQEETAQDAAREHTPASLVVDDGSAAVVEAQTKGVRDVVVSPSARSVAPHPRDLIPDLDPWYTGSLERYITMLRLEAAAPAVKEKLKVFTEFLVSESTIRGLPYPPLQPSQSLVTRVVPLQETVPSDSVPGRKPKVAVQPAEQAEPAAEEYSPGGRPLAGRRQQHPPDIDTSGGVNQPREAFPAFDNYQQQPPPPTTTVTRAETLPKPDSAAYKPYRNSLTGSSSDAGALTPASSTGEDHIGSKTVSPASQGTAPEQHAYKPYSPGEAGVVPPNIATQLPQAPRMSVSSSTPTTHPRNKSVEGDIFFGGSPQPVPSPKQPTRSPKSTPSVAQSAFPQSTTPALRQQQVTEQSQPQPTPPAVTPLLPKGPDLAPLHALNDILPSGLPDGTSAPLHPHLIPMRTTLSLYPIDFSWIEDLTKPFESNISKQRKTLEAARRKRQEDSEAHTDQLFNDNEISYADIGQLEDTFKRQEAELKAQEDREEYAKYNHEVFTPVFERLQREIHGLMETFFTLDGIVREGVAGRAGVEASAIGADEHPPVPSDPNSSKKTPISVVQSLRILLETTAAIEAHHAEVVHAVAERDKRYKKTEISPLYARGDIGKMKAVEKHFESAERNAVLRAAEEKDTRQKGVMRIVDAAVVGGVEVNQTYLEEVMRVLQELPSQAPRFAPFAGPDDREAEEAKDEAATLIRAKTLVAARETVRLLCENSKALMTIFHDVEQSLNDADFSLSVAKAKVSGVDKTVFEKLEVEKGKEDRRLRGELDKRLEIVAEDLASAEKIIGDLEKGDAPPPRERAATTTDASQARDMYDEVEERKRKALEEAKRRNGDFEDFS